ncbi:MAG TPA: hypothetical protein VI603_02185 [Saprospiraceae bacterium]|nr:hypothetical protein [Saprospiraceae bacterium]
MLFVFKYLFLHVSPKLPVLVLILCGSSLATSGQQVILNTRSERIVVYPDGSWRYYERGDSVLMHKNMTKEDVMLPEEKEGMLFEKPSINPAEDADISALANRFADRVSTETNEARRALTKSVEDKFDAEARLNQAQDNRELIEPDILAALEDDYEVFTLTVKNTRKHVQWMEKFNSKTQEMIKLPVQKKPKAMNKLIARYDVYFAKPESPKQTVAPVLASPGTSRPDSRVTTPKQAANPRNTIATSTTSTDDDNSYKRAPVPCVLSQPNGASRATMAVEKQLLFTHTEEELRPYFRQQELVTCYASLMQIEDNLYVSLEFQIASPDARKNFGILENNSMLRLKLMDGTFINLFNAPADHGRIDAYTGNTVYTGNYLIDREAEKVLSKHELDKLRVVWSTGFEDYDVVYLDFLINQFDCLRSQ